MKKFVFLVFFCVNSIVAQNSINQYKYVIVPAQFSFLKENDEYKLNTLTKLVLEKYGFKPYFDTEKLPTEISDSNCDKLYVDVLSSGNFIRTKLQLILKDCRRNIVYQTAIGSSKEKEYRVAYTQALRAACQSFETLNYHYTPLDRKNEIQNKEVPINATFIMSDSFDQTMETLYAQPISNGYQLVDATPKVIMKIFKTSNSNTFSAVKGTTQGVLLMKENQWFFEYYQEDKLVSEKVNLKF